MLRTKVLKENGCHLTDQGVKKNIAYVAINETTEETQAESTEYRRENVRSICIVATKGVRDKAEAADNDVNVLVENYQTDLGRHIDLRKVEIPQYCRD